VKQNRLRNGSCPDCGQLIAGRWNSAASAEPIPFESGERSKYDFLNL
jgi:hypothetical protein